MSKHSYENNCTQSQSTAGKSGSYSNINYMNTNFVSQGWQCPICKRILAPFVPECPCGGQGMETWTTTNGTANQTITMNYPEDFEEQEHHCYCCAPKHMKEDN